MKIMKFKKITSKHLRDLYLMSKKNQIVMKYFLEEIENTDKIK